MAVVELDGWPKLFDALLSKLSYICKQLRLAKLGYPAKSHSNNAKFNLSPLPNLPDEQRIGKQNK